MALSRSKKDDSKKKEELEPITTVSCKKKLLEEVFKMARPYMPKTGQQFLQTGCWILDLVLNGGYPYGQCTVLQGADQAGKTLLATTAMKIAQAFGGHAVYVETETKYNAEFATAIGLNHSPEKLTRFSPLNLESAFEIIEQAIMAFKDNTTPTVIVLDSVANAYSRHNCLKQDKYLTGTRAFASSTHMLDILKDKAVASEARVVSAFFSRDPFKLMADSNIVLLILNQLRDNIGVMYGEKETTPGGRSLKHNAALRLKVESKGSLKLGSESLRVDMSEGSLVNRPGDWIGVSVLKNNNGVPANRECWMPMFYRSVDGYAAGVDDAYSILAFLQTNKALEFYRKQFTYKGQKYSIELLRELMYTNPEVYADMRMLSEEVFNNLQ